VAAARLGATTCMVGRVGEDDFGRQLRKGLAEDGVDVAHLSAAPGGRTGVALIIVQASGENSIVVAAGANGALSPQDVCSARTVIEAADVLLAQLEIPLETVEAAIALARGKNMMTVLDAGPACSLPAELVRAVDVLSPNLGEAETLLGHPVADALSAARELVAAGARACVVKSGAQGCAWASPQGAGRSPGVAVEPVDTTGAGDAFTAALGVALAEGCDLPGAAQWANFAGALAVTRFGAQPSMPTRAELESFIAGRSRDH